MPKLKRDLLVSIADANFIPQVKQLFSSVYYNSGWEGDYMLLSDSLSEDDKSWFKERGILVFCPPLLSQETFGHRFYPPLLFSKLYLFHSYFKKWRSVIFLDSDIIVRASISALVGLPGFNAPVAVDIKLKNEFIPEAKKELSKMYNLNGSAFTTGTFSFDTDIIKPETFSKMLALFEKYHHLCFFGEEAVMNLFFYKQWNKLSKLYNFVPWHMYHYYSIKDFNFPAPVIHWVCSEKPWEKDHVNSEEWEKNLSRADRIDLQHRLPAVKIWSDKDVRFFVLNIRIRNIFYFFRSIARYVDRQIGRLGLLIKKYNPSLYEKVKIEKDEKNNPFKKRG